MDTNPPSATKNANSNGRGGHRTTTRSPALSLRAGGRGTRGNAVMIDDDDDFQPARPQPRLATRRLSSSAAPRPAAALPVPVPVPVPVPPRSAANRAVGRSPRTRRQTCFHYSQEAPKAAAVTACLSPKRAAAAAGHQPRKRARCEQAACCPLDASVWQRVRSCELESLHPAGHAHEEPRPRRLHQPATDRHTPIVLVNDPSDDEFADLPAGEQRRVERLRGRVLHDGLVPSRELPRLLCEWWSSIRLKCDPGHRVGCWLADYATNKPGGRGYWQARLRGQQWLGHVLSYLLWYRCIDPVLPVSHTCLQGMCLNPRHLVQEISAENQNRRRCRVLSQRGRCPHSPPCCGQPGSP